ncbi:hypothetical protein [Pseudokineococcus marinus]|uniref:hypothetical protein n=1 Tax=Pseudokineococcus marinus TaxID=351215 RepID=UPI0031E2870C
MPTPTAPTDWRPTDRRRGAAPRRARRAVLALPAAAVLLLAAGCGDDPETPASVDVPGGEPTTLGPSEGPTGPTETPSPTATTQEPAPPTSTATAQGVPRDFTADLTVTYDDGAGTAQTYDLVCDGAQASGTALDPAAACAAVAGAGAEAFAPPRGDVQCTQVFGGPQAALVSGTVDGSPVSADLARADGCQISRWDALVPLVPGGDV